MLTSCTKGERNVLYILSSPLISWRWDILCTDCFKLPCLCTAVKTKMCFSLIVSFVLFFQVYFLLGFSVLLVNGEVYDAEEMHALSFALMHSLALAFSVVFKDMQDLLTLNQVS